MKVPLLLFHVVQFCCDVSVLTEVVNTITGGISYKVTQDKIDLPLKQLLSNSDSGCVLIKLGTM